MADTSSRRLELDTLRALAIIAVMLLHIGGLYFPVFSPDSRQFKFLLILDQVMRFSVPLFVALSGYMLAFSFREKPLFLKDFFFRRAFKILPWYVVLLVIIYFYIRFYSATPIDVIGYPLWQIVLLGKADYHLYFVPMIFQLYLMFPLFVYFKKYIKHFLVLAFVIQTFVIGFTTLFSQRLITLNFKWGDQEQYLWSFTWIFYFVLGIFLALKGQFAKREIVLLKLASLVVVIGGIVWCIRDAFSFNETYKSLLYATRFTRFPVMFYATGLILFSILWFEKLSHLPILFLSMLAYIGKRSFLIYLVHTIVLREVLRFVAPVDLSDYFLTVILTIYLSLGFAELLAIVAQLLEKSLHFGKKPQKTGN